MSKYKILVLDDNPTALKLMRVVLRDEAFDVRTAIDADAALAVLAVFQPDLILMDIQLPGMNGLDLTRRLKADPKTRDIAIYALTAYAMKGDREKALAAGCDRYITKPIDTHVLPQLLKQDLQKKHAS